MANTLPSGDLIFTFKLSPSDNDSYIGEIVDANYSHFAPKNEHYDNEGALFYVLAVIFMYGCSILMMIGSFVKKTKHDNTMASYMKDLGTVEKLELKQEKFRTNLHIHQKKVHRILGPDRAEVVDESRSVYSMSPSPSSLGEDVFTWDTSGLSGLGERRQSCVSIATTIVCSDDLQDGMLSSNYTGGHEVDDHHLLSPPASPGILSRSSQSSASISPTLTTSVRVLCPSSPSLSHHIPEVRIHTCQ